MQRKKIASATREAKYAETKYCHYCGAKTLKRNRHLDHIVPVQSGGTNDPDNLVVSCKSCNTAKSTTDYWTFIEKQIAKHTLALKTLRVLTDNKQKG